MNVTEAAQQLGCSSRLVYQLCDKQLLGHHRIGVGRGRIVIQPEHIASYQAKKEVIPVDECPAPEPAAGRTPKLIVRDYVGEYERRRRAR